MDRPRVDDQLLELIRLEVAARLAVETEPIRIRVASLEAQVLAGSPLQPMSPPHSPREQKNSRGGLSYSLLPYREDSGGCSANIRGATSLAACDEDPLPESLFNFCVERLAVSERPWRDPAVLYLLVLVLMQQLLVNAFVLSNTSAVLMQFHKPPDQREPSMMDCMYGQLALEGCPLVFILVSLVGLTLVGLAIKSDRDDVLRAVFPARSQGALLWCFVTGVWYLQVVYLPSFFAVEAAALFARSQDILEVIFNTLAVTFILEVDNMLYSGLLSKEQTGHYQSLFSRSDRPKETEAVGGLSWLGFASTASIQVVYFLSVAVTARKIGGEAFMELVQKLQNLYALSAGVLGVIYFRASGTMQDRPVAFRLLADVLVFVLSAMASCCIYLSVSILLHGGVDEAFHELQCIEAMM